MIVKPYHEQADLETHKVKFVGGVFDGRGMMVSQVSEFTNIMLPEKRKVRWCTMLHTIQAEQFYQLFDAGDHFEYVLIKTLDMITEQRQLEFPGLMSDWIQ